VTTSPSVPASPDLLAELETAIDRVESALRACPDDRLAAPCWRVLQSDAWMPKGRTDEELQEFSAFWATAAHAIFFLDFYLDDGSGPFDPAFPHFDAGLDDKMQALLPNPPLGRDELLTALEAGRLKARRVLPAVTDDQLALRMPSWHPWAGTTFADLLNVNLQHMQEHGAHMEAVLTS
jgi:hypothetical protein